MSRKDFHGLQGLALAGMICCGQVLAAQEHYDPPTHVKLPPHGIEFAWREVLSVAQVRGPGGDCVFNNAERIVLEEDACILRIEVARDASVCRSIVERGEPRNRKRCAKGAFYARYQPDNREASIIEERRKTDVEKSPSGKAMMSAFASAFVVPAFYTLVTRSTVTPQPTAAAAPLQKHVEVSPPYRSHEKGRLAAAAPARVSTD